MALDKTIKKRAEVPQADKWNVEALYPSWDKWQEDFDTWTRPEEEIHWPELSQKNFNLEELEDVKKLLDLLMKIEQNIAKLYTYAHLRHDEEVSEEVAKKGYILSMGALHAFRAELSWVEPAILQLDSKVLQKILASDKLKEYRVYLEKIVRLKPHTLNAKEEHLVALSERALQASQQVFSAFSNADLKFPACKDEEGNLHELTYGTYLVYIKGKDRTLRKEAFTNMHEAFGAYENMLCALIEGQVQKTLFGARVRKFSSCLESALFPNEIDVDVYHSLIQAVRKGLPVLHEYLAFRKKRMGYPKLHLYDLSVSIVEDLEIKMDYDEAVSVILESVRPLGEEYQSILRKGLIEDRWVDRYENRKKRSGAYSSGCYGSMPYMLMNYHGTLQDAMTLAHEAGHSMHSYYSHQHQKYQDSSYSIFVAEVASTFHEELLFNLLLEKASSRQEKAYLVNQKLDGIRSTFFRQTLFAEFELQIHEWAEQDVPLTPSLLKETYLKLNQEYFGSEVEMDEAIMWEWSRIPHFYSSFYVYQYATGISAAHMLAKNVLDGKKGASQRYLDFISAGSSIDPLTVLKKAGADMKSPAPVVSMVSYFQELERELKDLLEEK